MSCLSGILDTHVILGVWQNIPTLLKTPNKYIYPPLGPSLGDSTFFHFLYYLEKNNNGNVAKLDAIYPT
jgi:hypothetical protein